MPCAQSGTSDHASGKSDRLGCVHGDLWGGGSGSSGCYARMSDANVVKHLQSDAFLLVLGSLNGGAGMQTAANTSSDTVGFGVQELDASRAASWIANDVSTFLRSHMGMAGKQGRQERRSETRSLCLAFIGLRPAPNQVLVPKRCCPRPHLDSRVIM